MQRNKLQIFALLGCTGREETTKKDEEAEENLRRDQNEADASDVNQLPRPST
jgi:hypothetical protein